MSSFSRYLIVNLVVCSAITSASAAEPADSSLPLSQAAPGVVGAPVPAPMAMPVPVPAALPASATVPAQAPAAVPVSVPVAVPASVPVAVPASAPVAAPASATVAVPALPEQSPVVKCLDHLTLPGWNSVTGFSSDANPDRTTMLKEFGCRTSFSKGFQRGQRRIDAVVYSFSSSQGAYAAYGLLHRGSTTFVARGDASSEDDQSVSIWKDTYFISVSGTSEDDEESKLAVSSVATQLTNSIAGHGELPQVVMRLPSLDRVRGSERLVLGPVSARRFFPAPSLNLLAIPNSRGGGIADYQYQAPFRERMKLLVIDYGNSTAAAQAYQQYVQSIEEQHQNVSPSDVQNRALFKLANSFLLCELREQRILLVSGARKRAAPMILARQVM